MSRTERVLTILFIAAAPALAHCGSQNGDMTVVQPIPMRHGTIIVEACTLDSEQMAVLGSTDTRAFVQEVTLRCVNIDTSGAITLVGGATNDDLMQQLASIRALGYRANVAFTIANTDGTVPTADAASAALDSGTWQQQALSGIERFTPRPDSWEIAFPTLDDSAMLELYNFVVALSAGVRPASQLAIWVPPSVQSPSDIAGGNAYSLMHLTNYVDRVRVMTLDYSCCGAPPGPTIDSGWAVDAARFALDRVGTTPIDIAVPLYGYDFGTMPEPITYADGENLAMLNGVTPMRTTGGELTFTYAVSGLDHAVWFDDAESTRQTLAAWQTSVLPATVGVVFYGLGAEDPAVWHTVAENLQ